MWPSRSPNLYVLDLYLKLLRYSKLRLEGLWLGQSPKLPTPSQRLKLHSFEPEVEGLVAWLVS